MLGDSVAVFAAGPIGLCAVLGAKLHGAGSMIAADVNPHRLQKVIQMGATHTIDSRKEESVAEILHQTSGPRCGCRHRGTRPPADVPERPPGDLGGRLLSSLGVYSGKLALPSESFAAGLGDH
jgi:threonine dehydrogenase-like Zn-dependent dehydrogenase